MAISTVNLTAPRYIVLADMQYFHDNAHSVNIDLVGYTVWSDCCNRRFCCISRLVRKVWLGLVRVHFLEKFSSKRINSSGGVFMFGGFGVNMGF